jgi:hypothetical protein
VAHREEQEPGSRRPAGLAEEPSAGANGLASSETATPVGAAAGH